MHLEFFFDNGISGKNSLKKILFLFFVGVVWYQNWFWHNS